MTKKQEIKQNKIEIINKIIQSVEYAIVPVAILLAIWNIDAGVYVAAIAGFIVSGLRLAEIFINKGK